MKGNLGLVKILIEEQANINKKDKKFKSAVLYAIDSEHNNIVEYLLTKNCDVNHEARENQGTPLTKAIEKNNIKITKLLQQNNADVNQPLKGNGKFI